MLTGCRRRYGVSTASRRRNGRPAKHQARQGSNARHANNRHANKDRPEVDWLAHIDTDEFLLPAQPVAETLAALPSECLCARVRPVEALAGSGPEAVAAEHGNSGCRKKKKRNQEF